MMLLQWNLEINFFTQQPLWILSLIPYIEIAWGSISSWPVWAGGTHIANLNCSDIHMGM